jgi:putative thiamine transport system substrate-binding protein
MHPDTMGNFTVLDLNRLAPPDRRRFEELPRGVATLSAAELGRPRLEPHPFWMNGIVAEWERRYTK